jgi:hypothetical protein
MTAVTVHATPLTVGLVDLLHRRPELAPVAVARPLAEAVTG